MNWRIVSIGLVILAITIFGFSLVEPLSSNQVSANTELGTADIDSSGFQRAIDPYDWDFPRDYGAHPDFKTEWWYYTGNVTSDEGRRFGFQFTLFRSALTPENYESDSEWRANQIHMAHFTVSDIAEEQFYHDERYSRGGAGLAGVTTDPLYHVWLEDWQVIAEDADASRQHMSIKNQEVALDFILEQVKPTALQGKDGLSRKGEQVGNASYYYSLSRLATTGTITIGDNSYEVTGNTWMDHEFATNALPDNTQGWDWFGLIFDNNMELMVGQVRLEDGTIEPQLGGLLIYPDGTTRYLASDDFTITATTTWTSPHTDGVYPAGWDIQVTGEDEFMIHVTPLMPDQELYGTGITYWEGAVHITGDMTGYGYAELTGYVGSMRNRF